MDFINFKDFLDKIAKSPSEQLILESIKKASEVLLEGYYPDDSYYSYENDRSISTLDRFNQRAAMAASANGNNVLTFLQNSSSARGVMFTDEDSDLDNIKTLHTELDKSDFDMDYTAPKQMEDFGINFA